MKMKETLLYLMTFLVITALITPITFAFAATGDDNIPTVDSVMERINDGKRFSISLEEFTNITIDLAIKIIKVLQTIAAPIAIISMIIGAIAYIVGLISMNSHLRQAGTGSMVGGVVFLLVIRLAPIIVATVEGFVK